MEHRGSARVEKLPEQRQAMIMGLLLERQAATVQELSAHLGASMSTIRRDLEYMTKAGYIKRTHGGALLQKNEFVTLEPKAEIARQTARTQKTAIATLAAQRVEPGQCIIFDSSSTVAGTVRPVLERHIPLTAVTNDLVIAQRLTDNRNINLIVAGGTVRPESTTLAGAPGEEFLSKIHVDVAFIGVHTISDYILTETTLEIAAMKRAMISAARKVIVLADSSKFRTPAFATICEATMIDEIITDDGIDPALVDGFCSIGVTLTMVKAGIDEISPDH